jgi:hypothetical protein
MSAENVIDFASAAARIRARRVALAFVAAGVLALTAAALFYWRALPRT